jgi:pyruvate/2-oxoglutarate dehydrogenase complex dihydrolipoamide acyltransferase (E2) component
MSLIEIKVPDIGDFSDVAVIEVLVKAGDSVRAEQSLLTVESDKASMEIPSSHAGVVKELKVALGDKVSQGSLVLLLEVTGEAATTAPVTSAAPLASASTNPDQATGANGSSASCWSFCSAFDRTSGIAGARHWRFQGRGGDRSHGQGR